MIPPRPATPRSSGSRRAAPLWSLPVAACLLFALAAGAAQANPVRGPDGHAIYEVQPGDTLIGIAQRWMETPERWPELQRLNRITRPARLAPGTRLRLPADWLRGDPSSLTVRQVGGQALLDGVPAQVGTRGREGSRIETGADGVVVITLDDGTTLTIPPASTVRIERLRQYLGPEAVEAHLGLERGSLDSRSPPVRPRPLRVRTPVATAAVRGTDFRVRAADRQAVVEVLAGAVDAAGSGGQVALAAGQGAVATADGPPRVESLLEAPWLGALGTRLEQVSATLSFPPVTGAAIYRVQVATDPDFTRLLTDVATSTPQVPVLSRADGVLHVRARAVSAIGIEGRDARHSLQVAARPEPPLPMRPPERGVLFERETELSWSRPDGVSAFRVQVAGDPEFLQPILDRTVEGTALTVAVPALERGSASWWWRVASVTSTDPSARQGPFSAPRTFEQRPVGGAPAGRVDDHRIELSWPALPGYRYQLELATEPTFAAPVLARDLTEPRTVIEGLAPGSYFARTRSIHPQGNRSPFGPTQRFEIRFLLRGADGAPIGSGSGAPVELKRR